MSGDHQMAKHKYKLLGTLSLVGAIAVSVSLLPLNASSDSPHDGDVGGQNRLQRSVSASQHLSARTALHQRAAYCVDKHGADKLSAEAIELLLVGSDDTLSDAETTARANNNLSDVEYSRTWGFGVFTAQPELLDDGTPSPATRQRVDEQNRLWHEMNEQYSERFLDTLASCTDVARREDPVYTGIGEYTKKEAAYEKAVHTFAEHPDYVTSSTTWAACMTERGYSYKTPLQAALRFHDEALQLLQEGPEAATPDVTKEEIATAVAAAECGGPTRDFLNAGNQQAWDAVAAQYKL